MTEQLPIKDWLVPIGDTGFYITPNDAADPQDCDRWPNSPWCSDPIEADNQSPVGVGAGRQGVGIYFNPYRLAPDVFGVDVGDLIRLSPVSFELSLGKNECEMCITINPNLFALPLPQGDLCYRQPECRVPPPGEEEDPPLPDMPNPPALLIPPPPHLNHYYECPQKIVFAYPDGHSPRRIDLFTGKIGGIEVQFYNTILQTHYQPAFAGPWVTLESIGLEPFVRSAIRYRFHYYHHWRKAWESFLLYDPGNPSKYVVQLDDGSYTIETAKFLGIRSVEPQLDPILLRGYEKDIRRLYDPNYEVEYCKSLRRPRRTGPPPPNPQPPDCCECECNDNTGITGMGCCDNSEMLELLRTIARRLGTNAYPVQVPEYLLTDKASKTRKLESLSDFVAWFVLQVDGLVGEFPIDIEIEDIDPAKKGKQTKKLKLPNLAESIAEIYGLVAKTSVTSDIEIDFLMRLAAEVVGVKTGVLVTQDYASAIASYLGFASQTPNREVEFAFNVNNLESLEGILSNSKKKYLGFQDTDKNSVREYLERLMFAGGLIKAQLLRKNVSELIEEIGGLLGTDRDENDEVNKRWRDFIQALNRDEGLFNRDQPTQPVVRESANFQDPQNDTTPRNPNS